MVALALGVAVACAACTEREKAQASGQVQGQGQVQAQGQGQVQGQVKARVQEPGKEEIRCPVMGGIVAHPETAEKSVYNGKTYYFCCAGCKPMFDADPEKYVGKAGATAP